jgi:hypothetical protein
MPKSQAPKKSQTAIFKTNAAEVVSAFGLDFGIWSFLGICDLGFGA